MQEGGTHPRNRNGHLLQKTFGSGIKLLTEADKRNVKTQDFLWRGKAWELKGPTTVKAVEKAMRGAIKQIKDNPGGIILDLKGVKNTRYRK